MLCFLFCLQIIKGKRQVTICQNLHPLTSSVASNLVSTVFFLGTAIQCSQRKWEYPYIVIHGLEILSKVFLHALFFCPEIEWYGYLRWLRNHKWNTANFRKSGYWLAVEINFFSSDSIGDRSFTVWRSSSFHY